MSAKRARESTCNTNCQPQALTSAILHSLGVNPSEGRSSSAASASNRRQRQQARAKHGTLGVTPNDPSICTSAGRLTCGLGQPEALLQATGVSDNKHEPGTHRTDMNASSGVTPNDPSIHLRNCNAQAASPGVLGRRSTSVKLCCQQAKSSTVTHDQKLTSRIEMDGDVRCHT